MKVEFTLNEIPQSVDVDATMPLLWVLRDELNITSTKFGCGIGQCGACTIHMDGAAIRSCLLPIAAVNGRAITTIQGLEAQGMQALKEAWIEEDVPQCGYCQTGQIMAAAALLKSNPKPSDEDIQQGMTNLCRCGTYNRIRKAILRAADNMPQVATEETTP
jgi:aerobic-type carbon monoxide dehydrogenase small subunit (CoxS/CutS family)